ncbi:MAG TPA: hydrogenase maturation nickel metallochaperone HypA [Dissulfurispiraceae bacterium]|nr:hydrogenase maturation nickel metallochaperone HypA [Dissulfurispiraceae bacterium]
MHELSIAESLLEIALENCREKGFGRIGNIRVQIGKASGIMPDALLFGFDALKEGTIADQAVLEVEEVPVAGHCNSCDSEFTTEESYVLSCPHCGGLSYVLKTGRELLITEMEVF